MFYEFWKNTVRTTHGICAVDELRENRGASWRRFGRAQSELYRAIPRHGFCTVDLPQESAGYRSLSADQRQRSTQLAHLWRLGDVADPACAQTVLQRQLRCRSDQYGLRIGCDDYRPVPVAASMGAVSHQQNGDQTAYPAGFARQYFRVIHITNGKTHEVLILSVSIFEKNQLQQALQGAACIPEQCSADNQLNYSTFNWILLTRALQSAGF
mgnify:CR=1 FL=1